MNYLELVKNVKVHLTWLDREAIEDSRNANRLERWKLRKLAHLNKARA